MYNAGIYKNNNHDQNEEYAGVAINEKEAVSQVTKKTNKRKSRSRIFVAILIILLLAVVCTAFYHFMLDKNIFDAGSAINGVDVSGLSLGESENALLKHYEKKTIKVEYNGENVAELDASGFQYNDISNEIRKKMHPGFKETVLRFFDRNRRKYTIDMTPRSTLPKFDSEFMNMSIVKDHQVTIKTRDAYVDMSNTDFNIIPEIYGDDLDLDVLKSAIIKSLSVGDEVFIYRPDKYYCKPKVKKDSKELKKRVEYCKKYLTTKIKYNAPEGPYVLKPDQLDAMIKGKDDEITVNTASVRKFTKNVLAKKFNTVGKTRRLNLQSGRVTVSGGNYGYILNEKKEARRLVKDLKTGQDVTRRPIYSQRGHGSANGNDIGDSYVEIDISSQMLWAVKDGKVFLKTSVVTGKPPHNTLPGVYGVAYMARNATLKGSNDDGSDYESHVRYWMPFNGDQGMHDADWRGSFGGGIYRYDGSHGCVNMPPANAAKLFAKIYAGYPVIVHD